MELEIYRVLKAHGPSPYQYVNEIWVCDRCCFYILTSEIYPRALHEESQVAKADATG